MLKFKYCRRLLLDIINPQKVETREVQMTGRSLHENKGTQSAIIIPKGSRSA